jgi:hypothetical protein
MVPSTIRLNGRSSLRSISTEAASGCNANVRGLLPNKQQGAIGRDSTFFLFDKKKYGPSPGF